jgi:hypothetical protein
VARVASWGKQGDAPMWFMLGVTAPRRRPRAVPQWNHAAARYWRTRSPHAEPVRASDPAVRHLIGFRLAYTLGLLVALLSMRAYARTLGLSEVASTAAGAGYGVRRLRPAPGAVGSGGWPSRSTR